MGLAGVLVLALLLAAAVAPGAASAAVPVRTVTPQVAGALPDVSGATGDLAIVAGRNSLVAPGPATSTSIGVNGVAVDQTSGTDTSGAVYIADNDSDVVERVGSDGQLSIVAGTVDYFGPPTPGVATDSDLDDPSGLAVDSSGNLYIADSGNNVIEQVTPSGTLSIVAGGGNNAPSTTPQTATTVTLDDPTGVAVDSSGNLYIADTGNNLVEEVTADGKLAIVAGGSSNTPSTTPQTATTVTLDDPTGVAVDSSGNLYIADTGNNLVEEVTADGQLSIFAGGGGNAPSPSSQPATSVSISAAGVAVDADGNVYVADGVNSSVEEVTAGQLTVVAGDGSYGKPGAGVATSSSLGGPIGIATDSSGDLFIADWANYVVEEVTTDHQLSVFAGLIVDGPPTPGVATDSDLDDPSGLAVDSSGNLYIADSGNNVIEQVTPSGTLSIVAGGGNNAPSTTPQTATTVTLDDPTGVAVDSSGNLYIADTGNNLVEEVTADGKLAIVAGGSSNTPSTTPQTATTVTLDDPTGVAVDSSGNLYIADTGNNLVEEVTADGQLSIFAGGGGNAPSTTPQTATTVALDQPSGVAVDSSGNLYIADSGSSAIARVTPARELSVVAGQVGQHGSPTSGPATASHLGDGAMGVALDSSGNLYIADASNYVIEQVTPAGSLSIVAGNGNYGLPSPGPATESALDNQRSSFLFPLQAAPGFGVAVDDSGNLYIADGGSSDVEEVLGAGSSPVDSTSTAVACSPGQVSIGAASTCTVSVTDTAASPSMPTGTVSFAVPPSSGVFSAGGSCSLTAGDGATASCQISFTPAAAGTYMITADYGGDDGHEASSGQQAVTATAPSGGNNGSSTSGGSGGSSTSGGRGGSSASSGSGDGSSASSGGGGSSGGGSSTPPGGQVGRANVAGSVVSLAIGCASGGSCTVVARLSLVEKLKAGRLVGMAAKAGHRRVKAVRKTVVIGTARMVVGAGAQRTVKVPLNALGRRLLKARGKLRARLTVIRSGKPAVTSTVTIRAGKSKKKKKGRH